MLMSITVGKTSTGCCVFTLVTDRVHQGRERKKLQVHNSMGRGTINDGELFSFYLLFTWEEGNGLFEMFDLTFFFFTGEE